MMQQQQPVSTLPNEGGSGGGSEPKNSWRQGPPPIAAAAAQIPDVPEQSQQQQPHKKRAAHHSTPPVRLTGRVHHHMSLQDAQIHAYQLSLAQQLSHAAQSQGRDLFSFQREVAHADGWTDATISFQLDPFTVPLTGNEPRLGLTLVRDDRAYTHIELLARYPFLSSVNFLPVDVKLTKGKMFLLTGRELSVFQILKYGYVQIPQSFQHEVNQFFGQWCGVAPIYFLMASVDARHFSAVAEMMAPAVAVNPEGRGEGNWQVPVRCVMCKNVPFASLNFVDLSSPMRRMDQHEASKALGTMMRYPLATSVLMDFKYYDDAEARQDPNVESGFARKPPPPSSSSSSARFTPHHHHNNNNNSRHPRGYANGGATATNASIPASTTTTTTTTNTKPATQFVLTPNEERIVLDKKVVYEPKQKQSNKERKQERKKKLQQHLQQEDEEVVEVSAE